ncbi:hypothetical protein WKW80_24265 [Variovorax humicola]|uniref:Uncharacterized protein n=1 Tax=Variovorax humicola TaxID=1769758 RepID=A0ABU8W5A8_9BURK
MPRFEAFATEWRARALREDKQASYGIGHALEVERRRRRASQREAPAAVDPRRAPACLAAVMAAVGNRGARHRGRCLRESGDACAARERSIG